MWRLIATDSLFEGVLLAKTPGPENDDERNSVDLQKLRVLAHSRGVNNLLVEFLNLVVNGSMLIDVHLVMTGQDHYYLVHEQLPDSHSLAQLKSNKYSALGGLNYTVSTGEIEKRPVSLNILKFVLKLT